MKSYMLILLSVLALITTAGCSTAVVPTMPAVPDASSSDVSAAPNRTMDQGASASYGSTTTVASVERPTSSTETSYDSPTSLSTGRPTHSTSTPQQTTTTKKPTTTHKPQTTTTSATRVTSKETTRTTIKPTTTKTVTAADARAIAERTLQYINAYRTVRASTLPNMRKYAEYRAQQLTTNFAHDKSDETFAATTLKYGEKVQDSVFNFETGQVEWLDSYVYEPNCGEAIGRFQSSREYTVDYIAQKLASAMKDSTGHWNYVGNPVNIYIAVGCAYSNGVWYCCICTSDTNIYG